MLLQQILGHTGVLDKLVCPSAETAFELPIAEVSLELEHSHSRNLSCDE
jgi:hypothetical protein